MDELFIQTLVFSSHSKYKLYSNEVTGNMRLIDWNRGTGKGNTYVRHKEDYRQLMDSRCMFARKFDAIVDSEIVEKVYRKVRA